MKASRCWSQLLTPCLVLAAACGETAGPVESPSISLTVNSMNSSDVRTPGTIQKDKNIGTETGNLWGQFIDAAQAECGKDPTGFEVRSASMAITSGSNVSRFEHFVSGAATMFFASTSGSDAAAAKVDVASATQPTGPGPVTLSVAAARSSFSPILARLVGGDFHVGLRAATSKTGNDDFSVDVRLTFSALAYCD